jgi:hypothetical protein
MHCTFCFKSTVYAEQETPASSVIEGVAGLQHKPKANGHMTLRVFYITPKRACLA